MLNAPLLFDSPIIAQRRGFCYPLSALCFLFPFRLLLCLQNAVYVLLDNVVFLDLLFQLAIIGVKGFFLRLERFIFLLQRGKVRELCNRPPLSVPLPQLHGGYIAAHVRRGMLFVLCLAVCVIDGLCLLVGGDVLHQHRHICKPLFNAL